MPAEHNLATSGNCQSKTKRRGKNWRKRGNRGLAVVRSGRGDECEIGAGNWGRCNLKDGSTREATVTDGGQGRVVICLGIQMVDDPGNQKEGLNQWPTGYTHRSVSRPEGEGIECMSWRGEDMPSSSRSRGSLGRVWLIILHRDMVLLEAVPCSPAREVHAIPDLWIIRCERCNGELNSTNGGGFGAECRYSVPWDETSSSSSSWGT